MPFYPGDPQPEFKPIATIDEQSVNVARIVLGSHTGTHVDAQKHFIDNGNSVDKEPLDKFIGEATTLDITNVRLGTRITDADLEVHSTLVRERILSFFIQG